MNAVCCEFSNVHSQQPTKKEKNQKEPDPEVASVEAISSLSDFASSFHAKAQSFTKAVLVVLQAAHSYILLTANIEDVQNVAKRLVASPISEQVGNIVRRAYSVFNDNIGRARSYMRSDRDKGDIVLGYQPDEKRPDSDGGNSNGNQIDAGDGSARRNEQDEFSSLGKSASVYLQKIKKIFENA